MHIVFSHLVISLRMRGRFRQYNNYNIIKGLFAYTNYKNILLNLILFLFQTSLLIEIPPYRSQRLSAPVHVNFYVCNGKRKRSQYQRFTYVPASGKALTLLTRPHCPTENTHLAASAFGFK